MRAVTAESLDRQQQAAAELDLRFPGNGYLLYAMALRLRTMDYDEIGNDGLVDGPDDKKVDFAYLDTATGVATISQGYAAQDWDRRSPPANKAADLNTALAWLLESDLADIGQEAVRAKAREVRDALRDQTIGQLDVFFVHNLTSSANVADELRTVERAGRRLLERYRVGAYAPQLQVLQVSREVVDEWHQAAFAAIQVQDRIGLTAVTAPQVMERAEWRAAVATVRAAELVALHADHGDAIFSANVRDFLGSRQTARNINKRIEQTAAHDSGNFWIFNNGITILTSDFQLHGDSLSLDGAAVINGAQTTGALSEAAGDRGVGESEVLIRVIACRNPALVESIIRFNNTQNPVRPWDLRAIDPEQARLEADFRALGITYQFRRSSARWRADDVHFDKLGPFLAAFNGDPIAAANKADLFDDERRYRELFNASADVRSLLFVYRLGSAVANVKARYRELANSGDERPEIAEANQHFRYTLFSFALLAACGEVLGIWLQSADPGYRGRSPCRRRS